jgi:hypothetical protein
MTRARCCCSLCAADAVDGIAKLIEPRRDMAINAARHLAQDLRIAAELERTTIQAAIHANGADDEERLVGACMRSVEPELISQGLKVLVGRGLDPSDAARIWLASRAIATWCRRGRRA